MIIRRGLHRKQIQVDSIKVILQYICAALVAIGALIISLAIITLVIWFGALLIGSL